MSTRAKKPAPASKPRNRGTRYGNALIRAIWLHLLHLGGRAQRPLAVHQAIEPTVPDSTRAYTAVMLARMATAGLVQRHATHIAANRPQYAYSVDPACVVPYGLSLDQILKAAFQAMPPPAAATAVDADDLTDTRILHITHADTPPLSADLAAQVLGADTIRRIREEFSRPYQPQRERA